MENIVIIGGGPAGLTAAIYAARAALAPLLIEGPRPGGQLARAGEVENYPGLGKPVPGAELMLAMREQAGRLGARIVADETTGVLFRRTPEAAAAEGHEIRLGGGGTLRSRAVIVATGASPRHLGLPSEQALLGRGVSTCATCDGPFFRGRDVGVVGGGDTALEEALFLARIASSVTIIHRRDAFRASRLLTDRVRAEPRIRILWNHVVEEILDPAAGSVTGVRLRDVREGTVAELPLQGLFIAIGHTPGTALFEGQLELDADGYIVADRTRTSLPGIFAAGDVQDRRYRQAVTAAASGCMAALEAERHLGSTAA
jgi:thioredoxin reductase (NADPH)